MPSLLCRTAGAMDMRDRNLWSCGSGTIWAASTAGYAGTLPCQKNKRQGIILHQFVVRSSGWCATGRPAAFLGCEQAGCLHRGKLSRAWRQEPCHSPHFSV